MEDEKGKRSWRELVWNVKENGGEVRKSTDMERERRWIE